MSDDFENELAADERFERRLFWRQLAIVVLVAAVIALLVVLA
jgi:ferric-dicitrate binding protein FerR (iron transport regulator)